MREALGLIWTPAPTLAQHARLLVDLYVEAGPQQRQRRGGAADAPADHGNG